MLTRTEFVSLKIYNQLGQEVSELVSGKLNAGNRQYSWDAANFAAGIYFYRLVTENGFRKTMKLLYLK